MSVDKDGQVTGVMDQMTADYPASTDPDPTQATLGSAFDGVTRIRILGRSQDNGHAGYDDVRLEVSDRASLTDLVAAPRSSPVASYRKIHAPMRDATGHSAGIAGTMRRSCPWRGS